MARASMQIIPSVKMNKPTIRLIHSLGRSGATVARKCLGVMEGVVLLSEINPKGLRFNSPLLQANEWFGLITRAEYLELKGNYEFPALIELLERNTREDGRILVIRDWNHLDFIGRPYLEEPDLKLALIDELTDKFNVLSCAIVRHPRDQINSLYRTVSWSSSEAPSVRDVLKGVQAFAQFCLEMPFIRYEDFADDPDSQLNAICDTLRIDFDQSYKDHWRNYEYITGDNDGSRGGTREIRNPGSAPFAADMFPENMEQLLKDNEHYREICRLLGYPP